MERDEKTPSVKAPIIVFSFTLGVARFYACAPDGYNGLKKASLIITYVFGLPAIVLSIAFIMNRFGLLTFDGKEEGKKSTEW